MDDENKSLEERVKILELKVYEMRSRVSEHQGFIWRSGENKRNDAMCCIFMAIVTVANLLMLAVQILR